MKKIFLAATFLLAVPNALSKTYSILVTAKGFEPSTLEVSKNENVTLKIKRTTGSTCARKIQVPSRNILEKLPLDKEVIIKLGPVVEGEVRFGCGMDMMIGGIIHTK